MSFVFYVPGSTSIIDTVLEGSDPPESTIYGETLEKVRERYPEAEIWDANAAFEAIHQAAIAKYIEPPTEVTEQKWWDAINIMPPMKWRGGSDTESFMICEADWGHLHAIYCRLGDRYFRLCDSKFLNHEDIVAKCREVIQ